MSEKLKEVLERHWEELRAYPNVMSLGVATKWTGGVDTGEPSIVAYVYRKRNPRGFRKEKRLPPEVDGVPVDVIELSSPDFRLGETKPSKLPPSVQRRIVNGVKK
jgi:hypothetical protein